MIWPLPARVLPLRRSLPHGRPEFVLENSQEPNAFTIRKQVCTFSHVCPLKQGRSMGLGGRRTAAGVHAWLRVACNDGYDGGGDGGVGVRYGSSAGVAQG